MAIIKCVGNRNIRPILMENGNVVLQIYLRNKLIASPEFMKKDALALAKEIRKTALGKEE